MSLGSRAGGIGSFEAILEISSVIQHALKREGQVYVQVEELQKGLNNDLNSIIFNYNPTSIQDGKAKLKRSRESLAILKAVSNLASQLKCYLDVQCSEAERKVDDMALRVGFSSLPDDILSDILILATRPSKSIYLFPDSDLEVAVEMRALEDARSLSHVCRKFRVLLVDNPRLWNVISEGIIDTSKLETYAARSKEVPLDILLENHGLRQTGHDGFSRFFKSCLLSSEHWRSFTIGRHFYCVGEDFQPMRRWYRIREYLEIIGQLSEGVTFPNLERLAIGYNRVVSSEHWGANFHPYWLWSMPKLVDLRITGCHPPPAGVPLTESLRSLMIHFNAKNRVAYELNELVMFLSSCKALEKVELRFLNWLSATPCPSHAFPSVRDVSVEFNSCKPATCTSICNSIHFPSATTAYLALSSDEEFEPFYESLPAQREKVIRDFLLKHPLLKIFHLTYGYEKQAFIPITPPIDVLPSLEKLIFSFASWGELKFWQIPINSNLRVLPHIRSLELHQVYSYNKRYYPWGPVGDWIKCFFAQLQKQGDLDAFELFSIYDVGRSEKPPLQDATAEFLSPEKISVISNSPRGKQNYISYFYY